MPVCVREMWFRCRTWLTYDIAEVCIESACCCGHACVREKDMTHSDVGRDSCMNSREFVTHSEVWDITYTWHRTGMCRVRMLLRSYLCVCEREMTHSDMWDVTHPWIRWGIRRFCVLLRSCLCARERHDSLSCGTWLVRDIAEVCVESACCCTHACVWDTNMTHSGVRRGSGVTSGRCCGHACVGERHDSLESETWSLTGGTGLLYRFTHVAVEFA